MSRWASDSRVSGVDTMCHALPYGFSGPSGIRHAVDLDDRVPLAVDGHVQPCAEEVLMDGARRGLGAHFTPCRGSIARSWAPIDMIPVSLISHWIVPSW